VSAAAAVLGYIHPGTVRAEFAASVLATCLEGATTIRTVLALESGPNISTARNLLVNNFLEDYPDVPWLFMCDTDMWFPADTVTRLIAAADPAERPVVGGLCFHGNASGGAPHATMYELIEPEPGKLAFRRHTDWPEDAVVRVSGTGAACLLMHRDALETVRKSSRDEAAPWFRESAIGAPLSLMGEDLTFCLRAGAAGVPIHVATGVKVGHMKTQMLI
jgi:GT2 family glycosyltransferase